MYEAKTRETDKNVIEFIEKIDHPRKKQDAYALLDIFEEVTGYEGKIWGDSIIGFGSYHYKYATGHEGDAPLVGFSPRKAKISLYLATGDPDREKLLEKFGKHTSGKACVYVNKLSDIDLDILRKLIIHSIEFLNKTYTK
ncbi:MAG: DUF1801 domain-containing protein [Tissierellia bacterium]|nr:DUF1801 domain-containing protein [Tissierellia bacterium]